MIGKDSLKVIVAELVRQVPLECRDTITLGRLRSPKTRHRGKPVRSARAGGIPAGHPNVCHWRRPSERCSAVSFSSKGTCLFM